ncbi:MAG: magnesium transporter [Thermoanaerobaculia bacterium]
MSVAKLIAPDIEEMIRENPQQLADAVRELHPADIAEILDDLPREDRLILFESLPSDRGAPVLSELNGETLRLVLHTASPEKLGPLLDRMPGDEVTFLLEHLPQRQRELLLARMSPRDAAEAQRLLRHAPRTAGRLMSEKFAKIRPEWTVAETLQHLRRIDPEVETVQSLYVLDDHDHLIGYVPLRRLFPANPEKKIADLMERRTMTVRADTPQEEVARMVSKYDVHAIPVVDDENHLVGIVTVDDVIDVLIEEQTEDLLHLGGVTADEESESNYFAVPIWRTVRKRVIWLMLLFGASTATGLVLRHFEGHLTKVVALAFFIPLLIGTGGNAGSQTVATVIRGLALGEIRPRSTMRVFLREATSGLLLGTMLAVFGFIFALLMGFSAPTGVAVGLSVLGICAWANVVGAMVPILAQRLGIDPTVMSAPMITTLVDATGLFIYFVVAGAVLGL